MPHAAYLQDSQRNTDLIFPSFEIPSSLDTETNEATEELRWNLTCRFLSVLFEQSPSSTDLTAFTSHKHYVELFTIIYILSNHLTNEYEAQRGGLFFRLDSIFTAIPGRCLQHLLHSRLASIRAAFETLIKLSGCNRQPQAFELLVRVGSTYNWLNISEINAQELLLFAVSMDLIHALRTLLKNGCRPDSSETYILSTGHRTAIVEALACRNFLCARLLLQYCDVNKHIGDRNRESTNFSTFLETLYGHGELFQYGLDLFIQAGASVDIKLPWSVTQFSPQRIGSDSGYADELEVSFLDYLFYFDRPLFQKYSSESNRVQCGRPSRPGVLLALESGTWNLKRYLDSLGPQIDQKRLQNFLQQLVLEHLFLNDKECRKKGPDLEVVYTLVRFGANIKDMLQCFPKLLGGFISYIGINCSEDDVEAVRYLIDNGAAVSSTTLFWLVMRPDRGLLDLARGSIDNAETWIIALIRAAARNEFKAVERLLQGGVDLGIDLKLDACNPMTGPGTTHKPRISIIAQVIHNWVGNADDLSGMVDFLVKKGAPLRLSTKRTHLYYLLRFILRPELYCFRGARLGIVQYIVTAGYDPRDPLFPSSSLLKHCLRLEHPDGINIFEYLFRNGAHLRPGSSIRTWITMGGELGLIREMLGAGVTFDAYFKVEGSGRYNTPLQTAVGAYRLDVVELLLQAGVDVNKPARGESGKTALQAACDAPARSSKQHQKKLDIIQLLLNYGANVNAAPARRCGLTALQAAAGLGDLTIAKLLLFRYPMADVNAPPSQMLLSFGNALDEAAGYGRLDMVKLLLNCNALSHYWGETGYDGAIHAAEVMGHLAVADSIRQHIEDANESDTRNPYLSQPARDSREYGYERALNEDSASDDSGDEVDSVASSDTSVQDSSNAASDLIVDNSTRPPDLNEPPLAAARTESPWEDRRTVSLVNEGHITATSRLPSSSQNVSLDASTSLNAFMGFDNSEDFMAPRGFDMGFDKEVRSSTEVSDAAPRAFENEGMVGFSSAGPLERLFEEVDEGWD